MPRISLPRLCVTGCKAREDEELQAGLAESRQEWERDGGREAGEFFAELDAAGPG